MTKPPEESKRFVDITFEVLERLIPLDIDIDLEMIAADLADALFPGNEYTILWFDEEDVEPSRRPGFYILPPSDRAHNG